MKRIVVLLGVVSVSLSLAAAGEPPPGDARIAEAVRELGSDAFQSREEAQKRLEAWGREHPETVLAAISGPGASPEIESRLSDLRKRLSLLPAFRRLVLAAGEDAPLRAALEALFDQPPSIQSLTRFVQGFGRGPLGAHVDPSTDIIAGAVGIFLKNEDPAIRACAVEILGRHGFRSSEDALVERLSDRDPRVFQEAMNAILKLRSRKAIPGLASLLASRRLDRVTAAARAIGILTNEGWERKHAHNEWQMIRAARNWWKEHQGDAEFAAARERRADPADRTLAAPLEPHEIKEATALLASLEDRAEAGFGAGMAYLAPFANKDFEGVLALLPAAGARAAEVRERLTGETTEDRIEEGSSCMGRALPPAEKEAAEAVRRLTDPAQKEILARLADRAEPRQAFEDFFIRPRQQTLRHLRHEFSRKEGIDLKENEREIAARALLPFLEGGILPCLRTEIASLVDGLGSPAAWDFLLARLSDKDPELVVPAAMALARLKTPRPRHADQKAASEEKARAIEACLLHASPGVRSSAAQALGELGSSLSTGPLLKALSAPVCSEEDALAVASAIHALTRMKAREALPGIIKLFEAEDHFVSANALLEVERWMRQKWGAEKALGDGYAPGPADPAEGEITEGENAMTRAREKARAWWEANKGNLDEAIAAAEAAEKAAAEAAAKAAAEGPARPGGNRAARGGGVALGAMPAGGAAAARAGGMGGTRSAPPEEKTPPVPVRETPLTPEETSRIPGLLKELGDPGFRTRQDALAELLALGRGVLDHLPMAYDDAEVESSLGEIRKRLSREGK